MKQDQISVKTPLGSLILVAEEDALVALQWPNRASISLPTRGSRVLNKAADELARYFKGQLVAFTVPLRLQGTPFQNAIWRQLRKIKRGSLDSYAGIAQAIHKPTAIRAVGTAIGKNSLPIFIPCHRIVGIKRQLCGFSGGLTRKIQLLELEGHPIVEAASKASAATI